MKKASRQAIIAGNWKMHKTIAESIDFIEHLIPELHSVINKIYLAVPFTSIKASTEAASGTAIVIGGQNLWEASEGPYTGEISGRMLVEAGAKFVIIGHSERREIFHESNSLINKSQESSFRGIATAIMHR